MNEQRLQRCRFCTRVNCPGCSPHSQEQDPLREDISVTCHTCGVELMDMQEQLEFDYLRNENWCIICGQTYDAAAINNCKSHQTHFQIHFNLVSNKRFNCIQCTPNGDKFPLTCHLCHRTVSKSKRDRKQHLRDCHSDTLHYRCQTCTLTFPTANELKKHRKQHSKRKIIECTVCPETVRFPTISAKMHHIQQTHLDAASGKFICNTCNKLYSTFNILIFHMGIHKGKKNFVCDTCGQEFMRLSHLQFHTSSVHMDERDFQCDHCADKKFKNRGSLLSHMRAVHSLNRYRYPCDMCDRVFKDSTDRRRHRWTHGGFPKPHACHVCDKAFHEKKQLRAHLKVHNSDTIATTMSTTTTPTPFDMRNSEPPPLVPINFSLPDRTISSIKIELLPF